MKTKEEVLLDVLNVQAQAIRNLIEMVSNLENGSPLERVVCEKENKEPHSGLWFARKIVMQAWNTSKASGDNFEKEFGYDPYLELLKKIDTYLGI